MAKLTVSLGEGKSTWIKAKPEQASTLLPHQLIRVPHGQSIAVDERTIVEDKGGHFKIELRLTVVPQSGDFKGQEVKWTTGYIYGSHWQGLSSAFKQKQAIATPYSPAGSPITLQPTPYFAQNDNKDWADDGSASNLRYGGVQCGLTSAAMVLATIWPNAKVKELAKQAEGGQFENWVAGQFKKIGAASTSMEGHVAVFKHLGVKATARRDATIGELKQALSTHPAIVAMAYSVSGHFTCGCGLADKPGDLPEKWMIGRVDQWLAYPQDADDSGVIINCPYGKRDFSGSGNNWINIARKAEDAYGLHDVLTNSILERFWVDGGEESGWCVLLDPSTPNAGNAPEKPVELKVEQVKKVEPDASGIPEGCSKVKAKNNTLLKAKPIDSRNLQSTEKQLFEEGDEIICVVSKIESGHALITLPDNKLIQGRNTWYVFQKHCDIVTPGGVSPSTPGAKITKDDIARVAKMLGCEPRALEAVMLVEAGGGGFLPSGRPKILFEAHWFSDFTNHQYDNSHPEISSRSWNPDLYIGGESEWNRFDKAAKINRKFAIGSCSWGLPQIMGAYSWEMPALGYADEEDFYTRMCRSEGDQLEAMGRFIKANSAMHQALIDKNWAKFAYNYNGESYAVNQYDVKLADAYDSLD